MRRDAAGCDAVTKVAVLTAMVLAFVYVYATLGLPFHSTASRTTTDEHPSWSYVGKTGPAWWGNMSASDGHAPMDYRTCFDGHEQSPVDIVLDEDYVVDAPDAGLSFHYRNEQGDSITNNGHTVKISTPGDGRMEFNGTTFELQQFHFHSPSEHRINGLQYPLEMHMVHKAPNGELLVFGLLFQLSASRSEFLDQFWRPALPRLHETHAVNVSFELLTRDLLARDFLTYAGSFTTPPCTEGVRWVLADQALGLSAAQMEAFLALEGHDGCNHNCVVGNNRPVQPLYGRVVYRGRLKEEEDELTQSSAAPSDAGDGPAMHSASNAHTEAPKSPTRSALEAAQRTAVGHARQGFARLGSSLGGA